MSEYEPAGLEAREHADGLAYEEWRERIREDDDTDDEREDATMAATTTQKERLEYLRGEIRAERISYGEIAELQSLAECIDKSDVELLEWAGVPEHEGGITPEGTALGHHYTMGNVNAYCPKCSEEQGVTVLDCDYDLDK